MSRQTPITQPRIAKLAGKRVKGVTLDGDRRLSLTFADGTILAVGAPTGKLSIDVSHQPAELGNAKGAPTKRQIEYLLFIAKYIRRFGRPPAESDIERHFLVSAPSVNQMMQTLEHRGFISRQPGVPRSSRICVDLEPFGAI